LLLLEICVFLLELLLECRDIISCFLISCFGSAHILALELAQEVGFLNSASTPVLLLGLQLTEDSGFIFTSSPLVVVCSGFVARELGVEISLELAGAIGQAERNVLNGLAI